MSKRMLVFITVFSLLLVAISLYLISVLDPGVKPKPTLEVINATSLNLKVNDDFSLQYSTGEEFKLKDLKNKFTVLYFGFAHCPDICPTTLVKVKEAIDLLNVKDLDKVQFIFVSIDPERDNLSDLNEFIKQFGPNIKAVSGKPEELEKLAKALKVYYSKSTDLSADLNDDDYYVDHSSFIYLLNKEAELISQFTSNVTSNDILKEIKAKLEN